MRVLHVQKVSGVGGSERHLLSLLPALTERGVETALCVLATDDHHRFVSLAEDAGIDVNLIPAGADADPRTIARIRSVIGEYSPTVVHTHLIHADVFGQLAAAWSRVPGVISFHSTNPFFRRAIYRGIERMSGKLARRSIAISHHVARFVVELDLAPSERLGTIHYGIDASEWVFSPDRIATARADIGAHPQDVIVGAASRLFPRKGHNQLIQAFAGVTAECPRGRLFIAGDGPLANELRYMASRLLEPNAYRFLGHVEDVRSFMAACDIIVFPTEPGFGEGFGLAALEAMCAAKPVVASALDSLPELVQDGVTGILVPPGELLGLREALIRLCNDEQQRIRAGLAGRSRAIADFSLERMVDETLAVYSEV